MAGLAAGVGWLVYEGCYRIPSGPELPPQPADRQYAQEVIDLNNQAVEPVPPNPEQAILLLDQAIQKDPDYYLAIAN
mgnify:CR=1 FL=1